MNLAEFPEIMALSTHEKLELVDEIWKEVTSGADAEGATDKEKTLLDRRWKDFTSNPSSALTVDGFKGKLRELRG